LRDATSERTESGSADGVAFAVDFFVAVDVVIVDDVFSSGESIIDTGVLLLPPPPRLRLRLCRSADAMGVASIARVTVGVFVNIFITPPLLPSLSSLSGLMAAKDLRGSGVLSTGEIDIGFATDDDDDDDKVDDDDDIDCSVGRVNAFLVAFAVERGVTGMHRRLGVAGNCKAVAADDAPDKRAFNANIASSIVASGVAPAPAAEVSMSTASMCSPLL
jgi:hypothetical protein